MHYEYLVIIKGVVQGVGFRSLVQKRATLYGLCGYVKNLADQSVEICLQGDPLKIEPFLQSLKTDSGHAKISELVWHKKISNQLFNTFSVLN